MADRRKATVRRKSRIKCSATSAVFHCSSSLVSQSQPTCPRISDNYSPLDMAQLTSSACTISPTPNQHVDVTPSVPQHAMPSFPTGLETPAPTVGMIGVTPSDSPHVHDKGSPHSQSQPASPSSSSQASSGPPLLWVKAGLFMPADNESTHVVGHVLRRKFDGFWPTFGDVPQHIRDQWWEDFKKNFIIADNTVRAVKKVFEQKAAKQLNDMMSDACETYLNEGKKVDWIDPGMWSKFEEHWRSDAFMRISHENKAKRKRDTKDGQTMGKHMGLSRSAHNTKIWMGYSTATSSRPHWLASNDKIDELIQQVSKLTQKTRELREKVRETRVQMDEQEKRHAAQHAERMRILTERGAAREADYARIKETLAQIHGGSS